MSVEPPGPPSHSASTEASASPSKRTCPSLLDWRVIGGITLIAGTVFLVTSLVFSLGVLAIIIASLSLAIGLGSTAYCTYLHFAGSTNFYML